MTHSTSMAQRESSVFVNTDNSNANLILDQYLQNMVKSNSSKENLTMNSQPQMQVFSFQNLNNGGSKEQLNGLL